MTKYVSGIVQRASPNVGEGRIRPAGRSLGTPALKHIFISQPNPEKLTVHLFAGMNSIFVYVGHSLLGFYFPFSWEMRYQDSHWEKLFQNIWGTALWVFIAYLLFRKKFFLKI